MSIPDMLDRSRPLAERVLSAMLDWDMDDAHRAARDELLADIAAADELARACAGLADCEEFPDDGEDQAWWFRWEDESRGACSAALAAYRGRMGVQDASMA